MGGQSIPAIDFYLAPFVKMAFKEELKKIAELYPHIPKDAFVKELDVDVKEYIKKEVDPKSSTHDMIIQYAINRTVDRVHQAIESFIHNANIIHSRGGNQVVFSSINFGTDTSPEGRCIIREILNCTYEGVGFGSTAIFPISILKIKDGVNVKPGDPNYDLFKFACRVTAKRFFPNFLNLDASYNVDDAWKPDDPMRYMHEVATMGCRTRVYGNLFGPKTSVGRGNLSFTTVNIVRLALECMDIKDKEERINAFFRKFDLALDIAAKQLNERYNFQATGVAKQFPMLMSGMWLGSENLKPDDPVGPVLNQGTLSMGFIGLAECLIALIGKHHGESEEAQQLGLSIISHMREKVDGYSQKYQHNYTLLATPAEGLAGRFTKKDRQVFGSIPGVTDKDYYTNSSHVPVYYKCTPEHKAKIEGPYHKYENAGHIFYVEMNGDATHNPEAIEQIVSLMRKYDIGYGSINHNRYRCLDCGYETATKDMKECPRCGSKNIDMLQRITGYLVGTTNRWNSGKLAELRDRVTHG
jgi:ribonucleoside-triphosphate reductase